MGKASTLWSRRSCCVILGIHFCQHTSQSSRKLQLGLIHFNGIWHTSICYWGTIEKRHLYLEQNCRSYERKRIFNFHYMQPLHLQFYLFTNQNVNWGLFNANCYKRKKNLKIRIKSCWFQHSESEVSDILTSTLQGGWWLILSQTILSLIK